MDFMVFTPCTTWLHEDIIFQWLLLSVILIMKAIQVSEVSLARLMDAVVNHLRDYRITS